MLWRCWLGGTKGIRPVKNWPVGCWRGICLERGADLHMAQLMPLLLSVSCFSKIQFGFTFAVPAHPRSPGQRAVKRRVCVCVCVCVCVRACACVRVCVYLNVKTCCRLGKIAAIGWFARLSEVSACVECFLWIVAQSVLCSSRKHYWALSFVFL